MMYALEPRVYDPVFDFIQHLIPPSPPHPLGCHRRRTPDRVVFRGLLLRLVTGQSWQTVEFMLDRQVSDTTLRTRRDEWIETGVFAQLVAHAMNAYQQLIGYDFNHLFIDGCNNDAIASEGTGYNPKHPGKQGWKFVIAVDGAGVPVSFTTDGANRQDYPMMFTLLDDLHTRDKTRLIGTLHADRGFNYPATAQLLADRYGLDDFRHHHATGPAKAASNAAPQAHAGSSRPPTPGSATTNNSPTTPTDAPTTAKPHSHSRSPCSSSTESPAPNTPTGALSANPPDINRHPPTVTRWGWGASLSGGGCVRRSGGGC